jgi:hypothetical protein
MSQLPKRPSHTNGVMRKVPACSARISLRAIFFQSFRKNDQCALLSSRFPLASSLTLAKAGESVRESFEKASAEPANLRRQRRAVVKSQHLALFFFSVQYGGQGNQNRGRTRRALL